MMARDRVVSRLVQSFCGISAMARALGHMHSSTVQGWKERRAIPRWKYYEIRYSERARRDPTIRDLIDSLDEMDASPPVASSREPEGCRYIHGDPKGAWSYCNRPQRPGSPYCAEHHALNRLTATADGVLLLKALRDRISEPGLPSGRDGGAGLPDAAALRALQASEPYLAGDPAVQKRVAQGWARLYPEAGE